VPGVAGVSSAGQTDAVRTKREQQILLAKCDACADDMTILLVRAGKAPDSNRGFL